MLMSWIPALVALGGAALMMFYPLNKNKMDEITETLERRRIESGGVVG